MRVYNVKFFFIFENRFFLTKKFQKNDPKITFFHFLKNVIFRVFSISPKMSFFGTKWPKSLRNPKYYFHGLWQLTTPQKGSKTLKVPKMHSKAPTGKFFSLMMVKNHPWFDPPGGSKNVIFCKKPLFFPKMIIFGWYNKDFSKSGFKSETMVWDILDHKKSLFFHYPDIHPRCHRGYIKKTLFFQKKID